MNLTKAQKIAIAAPFPKRRGLDKSKLDAVEEVPETQEWQMDADEVQDEPDDEYEDGATNTLDEEEEFNAHAEELFMDKLDRWFAEFGPKLYDLGLSKHLSKMEKKKLKEESSETSRRSTKKRKS